MSLITGVDPESPLAGLGQAPIKHRNRGIIGPDNLRCQHAGHHQLVQRPEQLGRLTHPGAHRAAGQLDLVSSKDVFHPRSRASHSPGSRTLQRSTDKRICADARRLLGRAGIAICRRSRRLDGQPREDQVLWRRRSRVASRGRRREITEEGGMPRPRPANGDQCFLGQS